MGPLTFNARKMAFDEIISIQNEVNIRADIEGRPRIDILNLEEQCFIKKCWDEKLWPNGWTGDEPLGDVPMNKIYLDGTIQPLIQFGE